MVELLLAALLAVQPTSPPVDGAGGVPQAAPEAEHPVPPSPDAILAIPEELRALLRSRAESRAGPHERRIDRLVALLFEPDGLGMEYAPDATHTVAEAFRTRKANCLTFTLLTVVLARELGVVAYGQEIERTLSWNTGGENVFVQNMHVNAGLESGSRRFTIDVATNQLLVRSPPRRVPDARLLSLYYNNRGTELMLAGMNAEAEPWLRMALAMDPTHATPWNNSGVLAQRLGRSREAEDAFLQALARNRAHTSALANIVSHYQRQGNRPQAETWRQHAENMQRSDPLQQFLLGRHAEQRGDLSDAAKRYQRAIRLDRRQPLFHEALARVWLQLGEPQRAHQALLAAIRLDAGAERPRYQAKLDQLRGGEP